MTGIKRQPALRDADDHRRGWSRLGTRSPSGSTPSGELADLLGRAGEQSSSHAYEVADQIDKNHFTSRPRSGKRSTPRNGVRSAARSQRADIPQQPLRVREAQEALVQRAPDRAQAGPARRPPAPSASCRCARPRPDPHLRRLDHHLAGQPSRGVEHLVVAAHGLRHAAATSSPRWCRPRCGGRRPRRNSSSWTRGTARSHAPSPDLVDRVLPRGSGARPGGTGRTGAHARVSGQLDAVHLVEQAAEHAAPCSRW